MPFDLDPVLGRMSAHLDCLAAMVFDLEQTVANHLATPEGFKGNSIEEFQSLDLLRQSLEDLAILSLLLAKRENAQPTEPTQLASRLSLDITRSVLLGGTGVGFQDTATQAGDLDLF